MKNSITTRKLQASSRRRWLLAATATAVSATLGSSALLAEKPSIQAKVALMRGIIPVASRTIRLKPISADLPRAVVTAIASDPRGDFVAVAGDDNAIRIFDPETMRVIHTLTGHRDLIRTLAFEKSGKKLISAGNDGQLIVWNRSDSFKILQRMQGTPALACVCFAPKTDEMAAVGFDNEVFIVGRRSKTSPTCKCDCKDLRAVTYRGDGQVIAVGGRSGALHLFASDTGELILEQQLHRGRIHDLEFHRDSDVVVSVAGDGMIAVFDTRRGKILKRIEVSTGKLFAISILNRTHVAVAGSDNVVRVVNTETGEIVQKLEGHNGSIPTLAFQDGYLISGGFDATFRRWSLNPMMKRQERIANKAQAIGR